MSNSLSTHKQKIGSFTSEQDGKTSLFTKHFIPQKSNSQTKIHLYFFHGLTGYTDIYNDFFEHLIGHFGDQLIISTMDFSGFGKSGGNRGMFSHFENIEAHIIQFVEKTESENSDFKKQNVFFTIDISSLALMSLLNNPDFQNKILGEKFIFMNPLFGLKKNWTEKIENVSKILQVLKRTYGLDLYSYSGDKKFVERMHKDQLVKKQLSHDEFKYIQKKVSAIHGYSYFFDYKSLFLLSETVELGSKEAVELFIAGMKKCSVDVREFKGKADLLNDTCRMEVFQEIIKSIKKLKVIS